MAHVKVKDLVAAAHAASKELPPATATLMRDTATRLDVTYVALTEAMDHNTALTAEIERKAYIDRLESRTVTIEPFRSFVTDADLAALHRFAECCDDPESGGHDLEKEQVRRLEAIGALQRSGRISYITGFGDVLISITNSIKWETE